MNDERKGTDYNETIKKLISVILEEGVDSTAIVKSSERFTLTISLEKNESE